MPPRLRRQSSFVNHSGPSSLVLRGFDTLGVVVVCRFSIWPLEGSHLKCSTQNKTHALPPCPLCGAFPRKSEFGVTFPPIGRRGDLLRNLVYRCPRIVVFHVLVVLELCRIAEPPVNGADLENGVAAIIVDLPYGPAVSPAELTRLALGVVHVEAAKAANATSLPLF